MTPSARALLDLVSRGLDYPDQDFFSGLPELRKEATERLAEEGNALITFNAFLTALDNMGTEQAQQNYVAVFDHDSSSSLYMAWHRYGNDRGQGRALAGLNGLYRAAGFEPVPGAMPDYLPAMLEFMALAEPWAIEVALDGFGPEMAALSSHLRELETPYADLVGLALEALAADWPEMFKPRQKPDSTLRPMAARCSRIDSPEEEI